MLLMSLSLLVYIVHARPDDRKDTEMPKIVQDRSGYTCDPNDYDEPQYCLCLPGQKISTIKSVHDNGKEDRKWTLACSDITPEFILNQTRNWYSSSEQNEFDGYQEWKGMSSNSFMVGMMSNHDNWKEDRKYTIFYTSSPEWVLSDCSDVTLNDYDKPINHFLAIDEVIAGVHSEHHNHKEDRIFTITICRLVKRCGILVSMTYDFDNAEISTQQGVFAGKGTLDNRNGKSEKSFTAEIQFTENNQFSDSMSFERSSGSSIEVSSMVTYGYDWGVILPGPHLEATYGFTTEWNTQSAWSRSNSREYTEGNSRKLSFTSTCPVGHHCTLEVSVDISVAEIPYRMEARSYGTNDICIEEGTMKSVKTWNAFATPTDIGECEERDQEQDGLKCGVPGSGDRVFDLRDNEATQSNCNDKCSSVSNCKFYSGIFGSWCIGCKKSLSTPQGGAESYKKCAMK